MGTLMLSGILMHFWYRGADVIYFWDATIPLDPLKGLAEIAGGYRTDFWPGRLDASGTAMVPYFLLFGALVKCAGLQVGQRLLFALLLGAPMITGYFAARMVLAREGHLGNNAVLAALAAGAIYGFNPYVTFNLWRIFSTGTFLYAALPLLFAALYMYFESLQSRHLITVFLLLALAGPALSNVAIVFGAAFAFCALGVMLWLYKALRISTKHSLYVLFIAFAATAWAIFPQFFFVKEIARHLVVEGTLGALVSNTEHNSIIDIWRLVGDGTIWERFSNGDPDFPWAYLYQPFHASWWLSLGLPLVAFIGIIKARHSRLGAALASTFILMSFVALGPKMPIFGGLFAWLFAHVSAFQAFRNPFDKFGFVLPFLEAILASYAVISLLDVLKIRWRRNVCFALVVLACCCGSWPLFTGAVQRSASSRPSSRVVFPARFGALGISVRKHSPLLVLPASPWPLVGESWPSGYIGYDPLRFLTYVPVASGSTEDPSLDDFLSAITSGLAAQSPAATEALNAIQALGFRSVLVRFDQYPAVSPAAKDSAAIAAAIRRAWGAPIKYGAIGDLFIVPRRNVGARLAAAPFAVKSYVKSGVHVVDASSRRGRLPSQVRLIRISTSAASARGGGLTALTCKWSMCSGILDVPESGVLIWPTGGIGLGWALHLDALSRPPDGLADGFAPYWIFQSAVPHRRITVVNLEQAEFLHLMIIAICLAALALLSLILRSVGERTGRLGTPRA